MEYELAYLGHHFLLHHGSTCVLFSTDVCAVTLRYMRVLLIDLQINVCVRRSSSYPVTVHSIAIMSQY